MNKRNTLVSALLLALGSTFFSTASIAQPADCTGMGPMGGQRAEMRGQRMQQRQQQLHDALKLNPEQEKAWGKFQESHPAAMMQDRRPERADLSKLSAPERAEKMLELQKKHHDAMSQHVAALKDFYNQLTPEQKKTFDEQQMQRQPRAGGARGPGGPGGPGRGQAPEAPAPAR